MRRIVMIVIVGLALFATIANAQLTLDKASQKQMVMTNMASMPMTFTENRGQWDEKTLFKANAGGATFWFCSDEIAYVFTRDTDELLEDEELMRPDIPGMPDKFDKPRYKKESLVMRAQLIGANPDAQIIGEDRLSHNCNYFYGNEPSKWRTDVPNYSTITYKDIYPGIDLKYHGNGQGIKYDFIVNPGADISQIQVRYEGADNLSITPNGDLEASTSFGPVHENIPSVYQEVGSSKREVIGRYVITAPGVFGFEVDDYNPSLTLVIDPELVYSTYLGGRGFSDYCRGIAVDASGNAYVTGHTGSSDFPTQNPYDGNNNGYCDTFVTKFSSAGNSLIYSTYL
ncbi:MAG: SBBP repeat-containing protein [candidate division Zixibacteria bacterium]|nr:SBBP repeat-containing protein [candidate division Zixibacteria bacterium]